MTGELKRIGAVLLTIAMALSLLPLVSEAAVAGFTDVSRTAWYAPAVKYVHDNGIMEGVGNNRFDPNGGVTRGMAVQMIYNMEGRPAINVGNAFTDVAPGAWYSRAVSWASGQGVVSGIGNNRFAPDAEVTREQMAVMLYQYTRYKGWYVKPLNAYTYDFADEQTISSWAYAAVDWMHQRFVLNGDDQNYFAPWDSATRGEVAQIFKNYRENVILRAGREAEGEGSNWNAVSYTVKTTDRSKPNFDWKCDYLQITDKSYPYANRINSVLKSDSDAFFSNGQSRVNELYINDPDEPQSWTRTVSDVYCDNGILGIISESDEDMAMTGNTNYYPHTFDLRTGQEMTFSELFGNKSHDEIMNIFVDAWKQNNHMNNYSDLSNEDYDSLTAETYGDPRTADLNKLKFAVNSSGNIVVLLRDFEYVGRGGAVLDTGYNVADLNR